MDTVSLSAAIHRPSQLQLAVALSLVRTKPAHLSISGMSDACSGGFFDLDLLTCPDYIDSLRKHITSTARPQFSDTYEESQHKYLNAALHFKSVLEESIKKEEELKSQLAEAEMEMERLRGQIIAGAHTDGGARKRKKSAIASEAEQACSGADEGAALDEKHFQKLAQVMGQVGEGWPGRTDPCPSAFGCY